jgi:hypothetical protein
LGQTLAVPNHLILVAEFSENKNGGQRMNEGRRRSHLNITVSLQKNAP